MLARDCSSPGHLDLLLKPKRRAHRKSAPHHTNPDSAFNEYIRLVVRSAERRPRERLPLRPPFDLRLLESQDEAKCLPFESLLPLVPLRSGAWTRLK